MYEISNLPLEYLPTEYIFKKNRLPSITECENPDENESVNLSLNSTGEYILEQVVDNQTINIIISPEDISSPILSKKGIEKYIALLAWKIKKLDEQILPWFIKAWNFRRENRLNTSVSIIDIYSIFLDMSESTRTRVEKLVKSCTKSPNINDWKYYDYLIFAYNNLFITFIGGKNYTAEEGKKYTSLSVMTYGIQIWWLIHIASPSLEKKYLENIAHVRYNKVSVLELDPETFVWDYVHAWVNACYLTTQRIIKFDKSLLSKLISMKYKDIKDDVLKSNQLCMSKISYTLEKTSTIN